MALKSGRVGIHPSQVDPITGMLLDPPGGASDLSDLDDVNIDNPEAGQLLIYDGDKWENQFASISPTTLASLQDVSIDNPEEGQQLVYNGDSWENQFASISPLSLAQLRDVEITNLQDGDFITYDSTSEKWVNTGEAPGPTVIQQTITIYSAVEDVISYTDIYGATQTEAFAANSDHKTITVDIYESGSNITFTSSVAKNPSSLSDAYSKTVNITDATSDAHIMPDNALYWYGYQSSDLETLSAANGWSRSGNTLIDAVYNKNNIDCNGTSNYLSGVGVKTTKNATCYAIAQGVTISGSDYANLMATATKELTSTNLGYTTVTSTSIAKYNFTMTGTGYISFYTLNRRSTLYALWYE